MTPSGKTVCLCMIVKNEAPVIRRCLDSARPLIDHWIVVDTGSTDGTQAIVREHLRDLPGALVERPWRDFAHNRTEALALARSKADYSLIVDADDAFAAPAGFTMPDLDADSYMVDIRDTGIVYQRTQLVSNALPWRYVGVLHEYLACEEARTTGHLPVTMLRNHDGARRRDPDTYRKDAALLRRALETETDPFLVARYTFYLAQSHRDCGERDAALAAYLRRATLGFWEQEVFVSLLEAARQMEALGHDPDAVMATYARASEAAPSRAEAAHNASRLCRRLGRHAQGRAIASAAIGRKAPADGLFVEPWVYAYGLLDEFAVNASWVGEHRESRDACLALLDRSDLPAADRERIAANARFAAERLAEREPAAAPRTGWRPDRPLGGTELMVEGLRQRMGAALDAVDLRVNMLGEAAPDGRPLVLWIHHDIDQQAVEWLDDPSRTARVDRFVFVSDWQRQRFVARFGLRSERCVVLRNATDMAAPPRAWIGRGPLKMAYVSAPYRGLSVLLDAWERLRPADAELHIWSSHRLYGPSADDAPYEPLYARARSLPNAHHHGIVPNDRLREILRDFHFLTYPSTFAETSCLAAIDAMAAGCRVICPDHGALPETVGRFGRVYPFTADPEAHASRFAEALAEEIRTPWGGDPFMSERQQASMRSAYDWTPRVAEWQALLAGLGVAAAPAPPPPRSRGPVFEALARLRDRGLSPSGIIDAGAFDGQFSRMARELFPDAHILMVDALAEKGPILEGVCREIGNAERRIAMLGDREIDSAPFFVADTTSRPDLVKTGSSKFRENSAFPMQERSIPQRTLAAILSEGGRPAQLIKLDIQGAEIEALRGLGPYLAQIEVILLEMSLVDYNAGGPLMADVLRELFAMGFTLCDLVEEHRSPTGGLMQVDGLFVRPDSALRLQPPFWG